MQIYLPSPTKTPSMLIIKPLDMNISTLHEVEPRKGKPLTQLPGPSPPVLKAAKPHL